MSLSPLRVFVVRRLIACAFVAAAISRLGAAEEWRPISTDDLATNRSLVVPDAGAEVLFYELTIDDSRDGRTVAAHYKRVKVFDVRGADAVSIQEIQLLPGMKIRNLAARVVQPGGQIVELDKSAFMARDVVRNRNNRVRVVAFSFQGLVPGSIVEYRWQTHYPRAGLVWMSFRQDLPARLIRYRLRAERAGEFKILSFRCSKDPASTDKEWSNYELTNVFARTEEPLSPPDEQVYPWVMSYPSHPLFSFSSDLHIGRFLFTEAEPKLRRRKELQEAAAAAIADASNDDEKLRRLFDFCRAKIRNTSLDETSSWRDEWPAGDSDQSAAETLKLGRGGRDEINMLFIALARCAGFNAQVAMCGSRESFAFHDYLPTPIKYPEMLAAVRLESNWRFFDPGTPYMPYGALRWQNEGQRVLVLDEKRPQNLTAPASPLAATQAKRTAELALDAAGTLSGTVRISLSGHAAVDAKRDFGLLTAEQRLERLAAELRGRLPAAELSELELSNADNDVSPLVLSYRVRVPGYAETAGQRLILQAGFFEKGKSAWFTAATRQTDIFLPYPEFQDDVVSIALPPGYAPEELTQPASGSAESQICRYLAQVGLSPQGDRLIYQRKFWFRQLTVAQKEYAILKQLFDSIGQQDQHVTILRKSAAVESTAAAPASMAETEA